MKLFEKLFEILGSIFSEGVTQSDTLSTQQTNLTPWQLNNLRGIKHLCMLQTIVPTNKIKISSYCHSFIASRHNWGGGSIGWEQKCLMCDYIRSVQETILIECNCNYHCNCKNIAYTLFELVLRCKSKYSQLAVIKLATGRGWGWDGSNWSEDDLIDALTILSDYPYPKSDVLPTSYLFLRPSHWDNIRPHIPAVYEVEFPTDGWYKGRGVIDLRRIT